MSCHYYLFCEQTRECIEAVAFVGNSSSPRIEANALQAFLVYHAIKAGGAPLEWRELGRLTHDDQSLCDSLEEVAEEFESIGSFGGYQPPVLKWTEQNYRSLASRADGLTASLEDFKRAPSGGLWVRRTDDGRII